MTAGLLRQGQVVLAEKAGLPCLIIELIGGGGQGEVYRAQLGDASVAVKWYRPDVASELQHRALAELVRRGAPSSAFLWPMDIVTAPRAAGFGYVMPLRDERFIGLSDLVRRLVEPPARVLATAGIWLAEAFLNLHSEGLCYRDISLGNAFVDPASGEVLVCDNDNVAVDGVISGGVLGTPRFMAPEVVRGEAYPSSRTDLFSLAVLLFMMLFVHHPFEGAREHSYALMDLGAMRDLYGDHPVFIFDPDDDSNRPVPGTHRNALELWPFYPRALRDLFTQAFTAGVVDPADSRVRESQWRKALVRLRDSVMTCDACGGDAERFWDPLEPWHDAPCWRCGARIGPPSVLAFGAGALVVVSHGASIFPHHTDSARLYDFSEHTGEVVRHPDHPSMLGLRNCSTRTWQVKGPGGRVQEVRPTQSVRLAPGSIINFNPGTAEVRAGA